MGNKKERIIKDPRAEYLKRVKSPAYVKMYKRNMEMFDTYNRICFKGKLKMQYLREAAQYFADDIKNPLLKLTQIIPSKQGE